MRHRFDPALYTHLSSHMQPLPDDEEWVLPSSTLSLAWGSTQTSYESGGRLGDRGSGMGPMSTLLTGARGAGGDPLQLHLSPTCTMDASRIVLVEHNSRSQGGLSVTMQEAREDGQRSLRSSSACTSSHSRPPAFSTPVSNGVPHTVLNGRVTTATAAESPRVIKRIIARYSRMRTDVVRNDGGDANADGEDVAEECMDGGDESKEDDKPAVKEVTSKGGQKKASKSCGRSKAREEGGGVQMARAGEGARGRPVIWMNRSEKDLGVQSFFLLTSKKRKELGFKFAMDRQLYDAIHTTIPNNQGHYQAIHPPNLLDTGGLPPQQPNEGEADGQARGPTVVGETSASDNMDSAAGDGYGSRSSGGTLAGKWKNAWQLAFDAVTDVMKTHSTVVADFVDRACRRQSCDVLQRQCDIMEREARTHEK
ncbi:hypothetical protein CBR_g55626 [Chara braunii]|uniref:Uncharacterized protein n=1 Tax=Chara braunii TaxID=69332 RepID=A0A388MDA1_CHABU|nr:hypothetical protein CBR_g55626 [Chara braunii]|eukprot:GBG92475.1 hypothetical protein CBR_g55626 [Chara braunii]